VLEKNGALARIHGGAGRNQRFSMTKLNDLHERLRILVGILGEEFALQVEWSIDSDYHNESGDLSPGNLKFEASRAIAPGTVDPLFHADR
jgi:hypothetical protein